MFIPNRLFFFGILVLAVLVFFHSGAANAQNCPRHKTLMMLQPELTKTQVFRSSAKTMTEWATGHTQNVGAILGLGGGEIGSKFQAAFKYSNTPDGLVCVQLDKVKAIFFAHPRMYIASDYEAGTCEYEKIVIHEKRHVKALIEAYDTNKDLLRTNLGRIAKRIPLYGPVHPEDVPVIKQRLMDYVMTEYVDYQNKLLMKLGREQKKIDSPNEYRGVFAKCENW